MIFDFIVKICVMDWILGTDRWYFFTIEGENLTSNGTARPASPVPNSQSYSYTGSVGDSTVDCIAGEPTALFAFAGFYGRPWTMEQRKELFRRYRALWPTWSWNNSPRKWTHRQVWLWTPLCFTDSRNGDWIHTFMHPKMTASTGCSGESCTRWKKQVTAQIRCL